MKFMAIERAIGHPSEDDFHPYLKDEAHLIWKLYECGKLREIYFNDDHRAVLFLEGETKDDVMSCLDKLPLVKARLIRFEIHELHPYLGFKRLFQYDED
ncbi:MAG TPA: hypothetical protein DDY13_06150 [Cytophagales bacterium]|jgi:hypothetical protein|nr:hypothetical protein [Cytophagales bacterium]